MNTKQIFLATGSNLGDRRMNLQQANALISEQIGEIVKMSHLYETAAWGLPDQPDFLNQVLKVNTALSPQLLLECVKDIERQLGRERRIKWGERIIDIDILFYELDIIDEEKLKIPHPFLHERNFVLVPLAEIAPDWLHPVFKLSVQQLLENSQDKLSVKILDE